MIVVQNQVYCQLIMAQIKDRGDIEKEIEQADLLRIKFQKAGNYVLAENYRIKVQSLLEALNDKILNDMIQKQKKQMNALIKAQRQQLAELTCFWEDKINNFKDQTDKKQNQIFTNNQQEQAQLIKQIEQTWPEKVKQSHQLLNLRKMQAHAAKQKNYVEAHRIQTKVNQIYEQQKVRWIQTRDKKIETLINSMKARQENQLATFRKRSQNTLEDLLKELNNATIHCKNKYANNMKQLKASHQRQQLSHKGLFTTKGGTLRNNQGPASPIRKPVK